MQLLVHLTGWQSLMRLDWTQSLFVASCALARGQGLPSSKAPTQTQNSSSREICENGREQSKFAGEAGCAFQVVRHKDLAPYVSLHCLTWCLRGCQITHSRFSPDRPVLNQLLIQLLIQHC